MSLRPPFSCKVVFGVLLAAWSSIQGVAAWAQTGAALQAAEQAICDGDDLVAERALMELLAERDLERPARFDALMLLAEMHYQGSSMERFLAMTDSSALLLDPASEQDNEAWSRVETNRCRQHHYAMIMSRAVENGEAALARYRRAKDKRKWKHAFQIHQALAAAYRNSPKANDPNTIYQHFDTALALVSARTDVLPYWKAMVWRSLSNAAMDRMRPGQPERAVYSALCLKAQRMAMDLLEQHHPKNHIDISRLYNLHGLYHIYTDHPDSALHWFQRTRDLIGQDVLVLKDLRAIPDWLSGLRWQAIVYDQPPWTSDTVKLRRFLQELVEAEPLFARYADAEATAAGLFTRDRYNAAPYFAIVANCQRLWALTHDEGYVDQALRSTERVRRDAWNTAQRFRKRTDLQLPDAPEKMLVTLRAQLANDEGVMICMEQDLAMVSHRAFTLVVTARGSTFNVADFTPAWNFAFGTSAAADPRAVCRSFNALYKDIYRPAAHLLDGHVTRLRVLSSGQFTQLAFDALLADTAASSLGDCHPLVEKLAISYPFFVLRHDHGSQALSISPARYIAPAPDPRELTDLAVLRSAMARWSAGTIPGVLDSSLTDTIARNTFLEGRGMLVLGGHCGGQLTQGDEPRHYWGTTNMEGSSILPSDLLSLYQAPDLVIHAACQSGAFYPFGSTGNVSFARAFLFAGSQQVVAAMDVADERTAVKLLDLFLLELKEGHPTDIALQRAKLAYLRQAREPEAASPLHWAVWQLWGEARDEAPEPTNRSALFSGLVVLMITGGVLLTRWRRKRLSAA